MTCFDWGIEELIVMESTLSQYLRKQCLCKRCRCKSAAFRRLGRVKDELQKALGQRVRQLRLRKGYSQEAFADHCGVHRTFMGTIERGETNLSFQNLARIAAGLGITLSKLFSGIEREAGFTEKRPPAGKLD
jgi:DNA-binding XRE family transcriptional regulator